MPEPSDGATLAEGMVIGRYIVRSTLGSGGMGTVVAADDPELDRQVAVKVLNPNRRRSPTELTRMIREAQSLAGLSHPNIVAVYDVGTFEDGIFIAMELVVGQTMRQWLDADNERHWSEVVDAFEQAGRGLVAVHGHGWVHRDFKPANVLIDAAARVRVTDFGLVRLDDGYRSTSDVTGELPERLESSESLTQMGMVIGTPAYMAPEQFRGERGDARSDQFAYCVALYEALYGVNPFGRGKVWKARLKRMAQGELEPPEVRPGEPRRLRRAILRGLSFDPEDRHASMLSLLEEMTRARRPFPRALVGGGVALVAVAVAVAAGTEAPGDEVVCDASAALGGAWDAEKRAKVESAFENAGVEYSATVFSGLARDFDGYAMRWQRAYAVACEARLVGEANPAAEQCLDDARMQLDAVVGVLSRPDAAVVERAYESVQGLVGLERCEPGGVTEIPVALDAENLVAGRRALAAGSAAYAFGRYEETRKHLQEARRVLEHVDDESILAELAHADGRLLIQLGQYADAELALLEARRLAQKTGRRDIAASSATDLLVAVGVQQGRSEDGKRYQELALQESSFAPELHAAALLVSSHFSMQQGQYAEAERDGRRVLAILAGTTTPAADTVAPRMNLTAILRRRGKLEEARTNQEEVVTIAEAALGAAHPTTAAARNNLANVRFGQGDYAAAEAEHRRVLEIRQRVLSPDHADLAESHNNLAVILRSRGNAEESRLHNAQALSIRERALGLEHPLTIQSRQNLAAANLSLGRDEEAQTQLEEVIESLTTVLGGQHPELVGARRSLASALRSQDRLAEADAQLHLALEVAELHHGADHPKVGKIRADLCEISLKQEAYARAETLCKSGLDAMASGLPQTHPERLKAVAMLAEAELASGRVAQALARAEEAWALVESQPSVSTSLRGHVAFVLARATSDRSRGSELAQLAAQAYAEAGPSKADAVSEIERWLESRRP